MEIAKQLEIKSKKYGDFIGIYPLFSYDEIVRLLTHAQVDIEFDVRKNTPLRYELPKLELGKIFSYTQQDGQVINIQITKLDLEPSSDVNKRVFKGRATFKIIK